MLISDGTVGCFMFSQFWIGSLKSVKTKMSPSIQLLLAGEWFYIHERLKL